jgi:hypothetical protein
VRDAEALARQAVEEVAGDGLARREADGVHEAVELRPGLAQVGEQAVDLRVVGHVAVEDQRRAELGGELGDAVLEALALVAEGQFGALAVAGAGDAVGDGAVGQHAGDQQALAGEKAHGGSVEVDGFGIRDAPRPRARILAWHAARAGCRDACTPAWRLAPGAAIIRRFPGKAAWAESSSPFFLLDRRAAAPEGSGVCSDPGRSPPGTPRQAPWQLGRGTSRREAAKTAECATRRAGPQPAGLSGQAPAAAERCRANGSSRTGRWSGAGGQVLNRPIKAGVRAGRGALNPQAAVGGRASIEATVPGLGYDLVDVERARAACCA